MVDGVWSHSGRIRNGVALLMLAPLLFCGTTLSRAAGPRPAEIPDTLEQRLIACEACHGKQGEGAKKGEIYPRLAGKPSGYLYNQLINFRDRRVAREPDCMARIADLLTPQDISAVAAWLANQSASTKAPPTLSASAKLPLQCGSVVPQPAMSHAQKVERPEQVVRGEYLARAGDCSACHTVKGGESYAGGVPMPTPFGTLYAPNITPDPDTGIGKWTADDFWRALHDGRSKDGALLYPAFPYTNYTKVIRADADDLFAYFRSVKPVRKPSRKRELTFPYNQRKLLIGWQALYFKAGEYQDDPAQSKEWNRGAYLVDGLGHCNACHSSRNMLGAVSTGDVVAGGLIPIQNWYAPSLTPNRETGLGDWDISEVVDLLKTGVSARGAGFGPMSVVVHDSLQHLAVADITAMSTYLKSQTQEAEPPEPALRTIRGLTGCRRSVKISPTRRSPRS